MTLQEDTLQNQNKDIRLNKKPNNLKKVIISKCLLGEYCRYDGKTKKFPEILEHFKNYEIIPFCPEAPVFGTPREKIDVVEIDNQKKIIKHFTKKDVTKELYDEIVSFCQNIPQTDEIVLKSKSPSCGYKTTPILDKNGNIIKYENGLATDIFLKFYKNIKIKDEHSFKI